MYSSGTIYENSSQRDGLWEFKIETEEHDGVRKAWSFDEEEAESGAEAGDIDKEQLANELGGSICREKV